MALLIGTAVTDHLAKKGQPGAPASNGRRIERGRLIFVYRAAFVGLAAFVAALATLVGRWLLARSQTPEMDLLAVMCRARGYVERRGQVQNQGAEWTR